MACEPAVECGNPDCMDDKPKRNFMMKPDEQPPFADFMGMKITHVSPEKVTAELLVTENLTNRNGVMHGGALMAFADNLGGTAATANLPPSGGSTATLESKTKLFARIPEGQLARAACTRRSKARPASPPAFRRATSPGRNARRCIAAAPPRSGRPRSPAATASSPQS